MSLSINQPIALKFGNAPKPQAQPAPTAQNPLIVLDEFAPASQGAIKDVLASAIEPRTLTDSFGKLVVLSGPPISLARKGTDW